MADGHVVPDYGRSTLADLIPSALGALGVASEPNVLELPTARHYVVAMIDGLGWHQLRTHAADAPFLASLLPDAKPITAGVPSTTATSLTSLGTGLAPGAHGVVGYTCRIPGTDRLLNHLSWNTEVEPLRWQPHRTAFERGERAGVAVTSVGPRSFRGSGLTVAGLRGGSYVGADSMGYRCAAAVAASAHSIPSLVYVYEGDLDWTGHQVGCESAAWSHQLATIDRFLERLRAALSRDAVLVVTADHGMVDVPTSHRVDVDADPVLADGVRVVAGEARFRHLYTRPGAVDDVVANWREILGVAALVRSRADAADAGWFGPVAPRVVDRIGDVVVASIGRTAVESSRTFPAEARLVGLHGSLTAAEMDVPLLLA